MRRFNIQSLKLVWFLSGIITVSFLTACQQTDEVPANTGHEAYRSYHINLAVSSTEGFSTRSVSEQGEPAENAINVDGNDFKILLFKGDGTLFKEVEEGKLDKSWNNNSKNKSEWTIKSVDDENGIYTISGRFDTIPSAVPSALQMMVLANWGVDGFDSWGSTYAQYPSIKNTSKNLLTIDNICANTVSIGSGYRRAYNRSTTWSTSLGNNYFIPMFGLSAPVAADKNDIEFKVGMLRAFAKIEIIDNLKYFEIRNCTLSGYQYWMRFTPDLVNNPYAYGETPYVNSASLVDNSPRSNLNFEKVTTDDKITKYVAYIPEMNINNHTITIDFDYAALKSITLNLKDYTDKILRNHIYRFVISEPAPEPGPEPDRNVSFWVYPWTTANTTITFD